nr:PREDICTED: uncharacterized protein LOC103565792 [Equus przewalskii]
MSLRKVTVFLKDVEQSLHQSNGSDPPRLATRGHSAPTVPPRRQSSRMAATHSLFGDFGREVNSLESPQLQSPERGHAVGRHPRVSQLRSTQGRGRTRERPGASCAPRLLRAALLLLLLVAATRRAAGAPVVSELRCQCLQTVQGIHQKNIQSVKVTPAGSHCAQTEVIATLKNGQKACLNPAAPMVKKMIDRMLNKGSTN